MNSDAQKYFNMCCLAFNLLGGARDAVRIKKLQNIHRQYAHKFKMELAKRPKQHDFGVLDGDK